MPLKNQDKRYKIIVVDVDGTMTNGHMTYDHQGNVSKSYHTRDISGLYKARFEEDTRVLILTGSLHECDIHRFRFLWEFAREETDACLLQGVQNKSSVLGIYLEKHKIKWDEVAFIGDGDNDLEVMPKVGLAGCPRDALPEVWDICTFHSKFDGGKGAVKEFVDFVSRLNKLHRKGR
jgi:3-deoxy-D-manno-octulosonate 8-phosphate phosphatase (KDO 8-P phosphatase)